MIKIKRGTIVNKKALSLAICLAMAIPTASNALSLGDMESKSSLNQPFQGRINLLQTNPAEVQNLRIKVASPEVFNRVGIDRPAFLNSIRFKTAVQNGQPVILVSSNQPINEPFLNFLLEVSWANGQLLKEYTVLLDPPVLLRPNTAIASNNAGIRAEPRAQGKINRAPQPTPQQLQAKAQRESQAQRQAQKALQNQQARRVAAAPAPAQSGSTSSNYRVRKGDTLSKIASKLALNGVRKDQMMVAMFEKNRRAFSKGNMNNLKAGAVIVRPSLQEARSLTARAAKSQIIAQARAWKANRVEKLASRGGDKATNKATDNTNSARLEVLGKPNAATANNSTSGGNAAAIADLNQQLALLNESLTTKQQENTELKSRVSELESLLRKKNRLIALKSEQLAGLQSSMSGNQIEQVTETQVQTDPNASTAETIGEGIQNEVVAEQASENGEIVRATPETAVVDNTPVPETVIPEVEPEVAQQEQPASAFKSEPEAGMDIMGLINSPLGWAAGGTSIGLLALLAVMRRRKNKGGEQFEDFSDLVDNGLNDQDFEEEMREDDATLQPVFDDSEYVSNDEDVTSQEATTAVENADDVLDDLIQEADVYIVYGLHDQAESEIKLALTSFPNSAALHAKLLENYKAAGDAEAFEDATKSFIDLDADGKQNHWEEICQWGNALLPDSKLYDSSALPAIGTAATGAAMVAGTAIAASTDDGEALFSDMGDEATEALSNEALSNEIDPDDLIEDTILDEFDELDIAKDIEDFGDFDDLDDLDLDGSLDLDNALDASDLEDDDELIEIADFADDFEIDLDDDFGSITDSIDLEEDVELAVSDEVEDSLEVSMEDNVDDSIEDIVEDNIEDTDFLFDDESLEDLLNADEDKASEDLAASRLLDEVEMDITGNINEAANLNLEIGAEEFDKIMPENHAYKSTSEDLSSELDLQLDGESDDNLLADFDLELDGESDDNLLADFDDNLSFLDLDDLDDLDEVIGETQIETKIDLARAYIDMGDIEGARSTLEEVMEAGNDEQKRQAEELLHQNG